MSDPGSQARRDQILAEMDSTTKNLLNIIRETRAVEPDEAKLTDGIIEMLLDVSRQYSQEDALLGTVTCLARTLVILSRTDYS